MEGPKLEWMYKNSSEIVDTEDYLLGKPVDKAFEQSQHPFSNELEKDCLPTSIFTNSGSNFQVDVIRKLKEDPLEIIKQQEMERRKQLLKNPVQLKKIQNMIKEKSGGSSSANTDKSHEKTRKKNVDDSSNIDEVLASKYLKIMKKHGIKSLSELSKIKTNKKKKKKEEYCSTTSESESEYEKDTKKKRQKQKDRSRKRSTSSSSSNSRPEKKKYKKVNSNRREENEEYSRSRHRGEREYGSRMPRYRSSDKPGDDYNKTNKPRTAENRNIRENSSKYKSGISRKPKHESMPESEKQKRLEEMMENAKWRDDVRSKNIAQYRKEETSEKIQNYSEDFLRNQMTLATSHGTVESRIKSKINTIQKSKFTMNENFARR